MLSRNHKLIIANFLILGILATGVANAGFWDFFSGFFERTILGGSVSYPLDGGTGTSTAPQAGQVLIGNSTNTYSPAYLTAGTNVTIATSSGGITISSTGGAGGITSLNGLTTSTQTFATSTAANTYTIGSTGSTHTFTIPSNVGFFTNDAGYVTSSPTGANPTAQVGLSAVNGSASTFLRSDGAPALDQSIAPTWTGAHTWSATSTFNGNVGIGTSIPSSTLHLAGSLSVAVRTITATTTPTATDFLLLANATSSAITINLPSATGVNGRTYVIKKTDASVNIVTIDASGTETIDGGLTFVLRDQNEAITIVSDNANWFII